MGTVNVLSSIVQDIYKAADVVGREQSGFVTGATINSGANGAAYGTNVAAAFTNTAAAVDITPNNVTPDAGNQEIDERFLTLNKQRGVQIGWNGEQKLQVANRYGYETVYGDQIAQAMRTLTNEIEADLFAEASKNSSNALVASGASTLVTDYTDAAFARKLLVDNGAPNNGEFQMVVDTLAGANIRSLENHTKVNEAGVDSIARSGILVPMSGLAIRESAAISKHTIGDASAAASTNDAGYAIGDTLITLKSAGTGAILAGDFIKFDGDDNFYGVVSGDADVSGGGTITLAEPGLKQAIPASDTTLDVKEKANGAFTPAIAFHRAALELAIRPPAAATSDMATDRLTVVDTFSGLPFEISVYPQYRQTFVEVACVWGVKAWKPEFISTIMG